MAFLQNKIDLRRKYMNVETDKPTLGFVGLGFMGMALAERALKTGFPVIGYDLLHERVLELGEAGGCPGRSVTEVADTADWIVYSLLTSEQVERSLQACGNQLRSGHIVIDTTTGDPDHMARLGSELLARGVIYLDATIAGNSEETRRGEVLALVGGDASAFAQCQSFFHCFAKKSFHLGPIGCGARMKLVFNTVLGLHRAVLAEALVFAERIGIPGDLALSILKMGTTHSRVMENKGGKMLARNFSTQAKLSQHLKDVNLILELGERTGACLPLSREHQRLLRQLVEKGYGDQDNGSIIKAFE